MTLGKSLNTSHKLWDRDPGYMVKLEKQKGNVCKRLLRRVHTVFLGNSIWMGFLVRERLQEQCVVLGTYHVAVRIAGRK